MDLPSVIFWSENGEQVNEPPVAGKFLLLSVFCDEISSHQILVARDGWFGHFVIFNRCSSKFSADGYMVTQEGGGGIKTRGKVVVIGGKSFDYGPADYPVAQQLLESALPGYEIQVDPNLF